MDKKAHYEDVKDLALNQAKHDMCFEDKARHARLVVAEKLHQEREMLQEQLDLHLRRQDEERKQNGLLHHLSDCRLTENERESADLQWKAWTATQADVEELQREFRQFQVAPIEYKMRLERVRLRQQYPDDGRIVPEWGKSVARVRSCMRCVALHFVTPHMDRWFIFTYARLNPLTVSLVAVERVPHPVVRMPAELGADDHAHTFIWISKSEYWRDIDLPEVGLTQIKVVPQVVWSCSNLAFSDFNEMPIQSWLDMCPGSQDPNDEEKPNDPIAPYLHPIDFEKDPWLFDHIDQRLQESSESEEDVDDTPERKKQRLSDDIVDDIFKYIIDKNADYSEDLDPIVADFRTVLRSGEGTYRKTGTAIDSARAEAASPLAKHWLTTIEITGTFTCAWKKYGEQAAIVMCQAWCFKMQYLFDEAQGKDTEDRLADDGVTLVYPAKVQELRSTLSADAPHWQRLNYIDGLHL